MMFPRTRTCSSVLTNFALGVQQHPVPFGVGVDRQWEKLGGLCPPSLSPSRIWRLDKYPYSEMSKLASGLFLYEVFPSKWHLGPLHGFV